MTEDLCDEQDLTDAEIERYARHLILDEIGEEGQEKLKAATVALVGLGGIGAPVAQYLAASGVGALRLIDPDVVDLSNLQRQVIHSTERIGMAKVQSAKLAIQTLNPLVAVDCVEANFAPKHLDGVTLVVDGTDNYAARCAVAEAAEAAGVPLVFAAASGWDGQLMLLEPHADDNNPRYRDVFPEAPVGRTSCADVGVFAPLVGMVGSMAAGLALQRLLDLPCSRNSLLQIDGRSFVVRHFRTKRRADAKPF